jgi:hypothetical protein
MKIDKYNVYSGAADTVFEFNSTGPKGTVTKIVVYSSTNLKHVYNLGFGDKDENGDINDTVITNNGDSKKVLATVAATLFAFTDKYQEAFVFAIGNSRARTRLYRIGITNHIELIIKDFEVFGLESGEWISFKKGIEYEAFAVKRKFS